MLRDGIFPPPVYVSAWNLYCKKDALNFMSTGQKDALIYVNIWMHRKDVFFTYHLKRWNAILELPGVSWWIKFVIYVTRWSMSNQKQIDVAKRVAHKIHSCITRELDASFAMIFRCLMCGYLFGSFPQAYDIMKI